MNEKQIICVSYNGKVVIVHAFTLETILISTTLEKNIVNLFYWDKEGLVLEAFTDRFRCCAVDTKKNQYLCDGFVYFEKDLTLKSVDVNKNWMVCGLSSGFIL